MSIMKDEVEKLFEGAHVQKDIWRFYNIVRLLALTEAREQVRGGSFCSCNSCQRPVDLIDKLLVQEGL